MAFGPLVTLVLILVLAVGASWLAWRLELPSILLLLVAGFLAGPVAGWLEPDQLFGDLLLPLVSFSVAIILFEGGLSLRIIELEEIGSVVRNLVTVGVLVTWAVTTAAAYLLLGFDMALSLLLGAVLVVTGPTVIIPLLRHLRPEGKLGNVLKWEGILIDPIGVILGVGVFEALLVGGLTATGAVLVFTIVKALVIGGLVGVVGALVTYATLKRNWVPDALHSPSTLALVGAAFATAEILQAEAGLVTATVMGVLLANRQDFAKRHIVEFNENLRTLLIGFLFVVLAARLDLADLAVVGPSSLLFLAVLFLVARPLSVGISTLGSELDWRERTFLAFMAPRGIVAAAISSVFALELVGQNYPGADRLVPVTFLVIVATVGIYGILARPIGRWLGVARPDPQGVVIVGAQPWTCDLGVELEDAGLRVLMVDTNWANLRSARQRGLETYRGNTLDAGVLDEINLGGIGHLLALTPNDEVNSLTVLHFQEVLERSNVYQLAPGILEEADREVPMDLRGRVLVDEDLHHEQLRARHREGWRFYTVEIEETDPDEPPGDPEHGPFPICLIREDGKLRPYTADHQPTPRQGDEIVLFGPREAQ